MHRCTISPIRSSWLLSGNIIHLRSVTRQGSFDARNRSRNEIGSSFCMSNRLRLNRYHTCDGWIIYNSKCPATTSTTERSQKWNAESHVLNDSCIWHAHFTRSRTKIQAPREIQGSNNLQRPEDITQIFLRLTRAHQTGVQLLMLRQ